MGRGHEPLQEEELGAVLAEAVGAVERAEIAYVLVGGLASTVNGRPRWSDDIDFLVKGIDALHALEALRGAGFDVEETDPNWIYKGHKGPVQVDVIFRLMGDIYLDEEMQDHARRASFGGAEATFASPEDMIVIKAIVHDEYTPRHWHDALGMLAAGGIDWDYLVSRSRFGGKRMLSLLVYAQSNDLIVPEDAIARLYESLFAANAT
jgi:predicted nucleotidyltransferase